MAERINFSFVLVKFYIQLNDAVGVMNQINWLIQILIFCSDRMFKFEQS